MQRNITLSLCAALTVAMTLPITAAAQETEETPVAAGEQDMSWVPAVGEDGVIRWGAARETSHTQPLIAERRSVPNLFQVVAVEMLGSFIVLEDGTRWEVFLPDRPGTITWQPGDHVLIQPLPIRRGMHTHRLQNGERADIVAARFAGVSPIAVPAPVEKPN